MLNYLLLFIFNLQLSVCAKDIFIAKSLSPLPNKNEVISLADAVDQAISLNFQQRNRKYLKQVLAIDFKDKSDDFWYPKVTLEFNTTPYSIYRLKKGDSSPTGIQKTPAGSLGLNLGNYNLFNWGKDLLIFKNDKAIFNRENKRLDEQKRLLRHQVIQLYYTLAQNLKITHYYKFMINQSSFIYRLNKERVVSGKIPKQQYYQSKNLYLAAQEKYHLARLNLKAASHLLAQKMIYQSNKLLTPDKDIKIVPIKFNTETLKNIALKNNPAVLDFKLQKITSKREYQKALRDNLPLPKISLNLGAYKHFFGRDVSRTHYQTGQNESNLDLVASINATWTLTGSGGLLNQRTLMRSHLKNTISKLNLKDAMNNSNQRIKRFYNDLKYLNRLLKITNVSINNNKKNYDYIFDKYVSKGLHYLDYKDALNELINSKVQYTKYLMMYVNTKIQLSETLGKNNLPSENFISDTKRMEELL